MTWPGYQSLYEVARATGADVTLHELREARRLGARRRPAAARRSRPTTRLIVVNAPHNPTGMLPDRATFDGAGRRSPPRPARISSSDEVYRGLEFDEADRLPAGADALDARDLARGDVEVVRDGRPADRLARDAATATCSPGCAAFKDYTTICSSAPSEILAIIALRARERCSPGRAAIVAANLELLDAFFEDWAGPVRMGPPAGRLGRLPAADRAGRRDRRLGGGAGRGRRRPAPARLAVRLPAATTSGSGFGRTDLPEALERLEARGRTLR